MNAASTDHRPLALVTGASSGIGVELARQFLTNGFDVLAVAEDEELHTAASQLSELGGTVQTERIDLADRGGTGRLVERLGELGRPVDAAAFQAVYGASKAFVQSFGQALRNELKDTGVTVTTLLPGPTDTEFFERADLMDTKVGTADKDDPALVVEQGFRGLMEGEGSVLAGTLSSRAMGLGGNVTPDAVAAELNRKLHEPGSAGA